MRRLKPIAFFCLIALAVVWIVALQEPGFWQGDPKLLSRGH
jgi:hypothetical protein